MDDLVFLPHPRRLKRTGGSLRLGAAGAVVAAGNAALLTPVLERLQEALWTTQRVRWRLGAGAPGSGPAIVVGLAQEQAIPEQGYHLSIRPDGVLITAADLAGAFYGAMTLIQLLRQCSGALPGLDIEDSPDLPLRGVMLDVSRDKVPTLETLFALVDQLAEWKVNHLQLYTEHTFAYRRHRSVWAQASPLTGEDILRLDAYCRERQVELAPSQNSFGHFHRWLELPAYRHLAECPEGFTMPGGDRRREAFTLDPANPESLALLRELYAELLPHFSSRRFNVGCDETFDLGLGRNREECERLGLGRVYLNFLLKVHEEVGRHDCTMLFWADMIDQFPELIPELPKDAVALEWGYVAAHPFAERGKRFAEAGVPFIVCPGTSTWGTISGCTSTALGNNYNAARDAVETGGVGLLNTDWGDNGHWQYQPLSLPAFAAGAAASWCRETNDQEALIPALDMHCFYDAAGVMGRLVADLGETWAQVGRDVTSAHVLMSLLQAEPDQRRLPDNVTGETLNEAKAYVDSVMAALPDARSERADATLVADELRNCARLLHHACDLGIAVASDDLASTPTRRKLEEQMRTILGEHRRLWLGRNREGGLQDSCRLMETRLAEYRTPG